MHNAHGLRRQRAWWKEKQKVEEEGEWVGEGNRVGEEGKGWVKKEKGWVKEKRCMGEGG